MPSLSPMILIRADANPMMGTGHVMRCLALADALRARGLEVAFAAAELTHSMAARLAAARIAVRPVTLSLDANAEVTREIARSLGAHAIIVDGYQFSPSWRQALRAAGVPILAFQDLDDGGPLFADLVLNAAADPADPRWHRAAPGARFLLGAPYFLLRQELRRSLSAPTQPIAARRSLLVSFGGADPAGLTVPVARGLARAIDQETSVDVVIGGSVPDAAGVAGAVAALGPQIRSHLDPQEMGPMFCRAGLAVVAAGGTVGEVAAFGVPSVIVVVADNQVTGAAAAAAAGWCVAIDARAGGPDVADRIVARGAELFADVPLRASMAARAQGLIDGEGAGRVAGALIEALQTLW